MMLTKFNYQVDESLIYHLNRIDDWFVFGSVGFRQKTDFQRMKLLFYKLIRSVEQNNKGQFYVRFEGDNIQRERHFHFLLGERGLVSNSIKKIQKRLKERTIDLALSDYPEYETCSPKFELFNPKLDGIRYVSKIAKDEKENLCGLGLDSCVQGLDWKMSPTLKKRITNINTERISHY